MYIYKNNYDANWPENVERIDTLKLCTVQNISSFGYSTCNTPEKQHFILQRQVID